MFASLVIVFPTPHEGGTLILRHKGQEWTFGAPSAGKSEVGYIAFYSDVEHEVLPVTSGYRVTLTYNLYFEDSSETGLPNDTLSAAADVLDIPCRAALQELLSDSSFLPQGGRLAFGLYHQYPYDTEHNTDNEYDTDDTESKTSLESITKFLKGSDATLYRVCKDLGLSVNVRVFYSTDDDEEVLLPRFIQLWGQREEDIVRTLKHDFGGEIIYGGVDYEDDEDSDNGNTRDTGVFIWATPRTKLNRVEEHYAAYGNEGSLGILYGDICLIVEIGDYASRK